MISNKPKLLDIEFRFQAEHDVQAYGDHWHRYNEHALLALPAQELIRLEAAIGAPLADVMNGIREDSVFGDTCAAWLALSMAGATLPDAFVDFSPAIMLCEWRKHETGVEQGKASTPDTASPAVPGSPPIVLTPEVLTGSPTTLPGE